MRDAVRDTVRDAVRDVAIFLLKVLVLSAGLSVLIKTGGPVLPLAEIEGKALNYLAIALVTLPSLILGSLLYVKSR
ncbi:MAG: hypothetical protein ACFB16_24610, partial [Phormidesmis sp.]